MEEVSVTSDGFGLQESSREQLADEAIEEMADGAPALVAEEVTSLEVDPVSEIMEFAGENDGEEETFLTKVKSYNVVRYPLELIGFLDSKVLYIEEKVDLFLDISETARAMFLDRISSFLLMTLFRPTFRVIELGVQRGSNITSPFIQSATESGKQHLTTALETGLKVLGHSDPPKVTELLSIHTVKFAYWLGNSDNYPLLLFLFFCHFVLVYLLFFRDGIFFPGRTLEVTMSKFRHSKYSSQKAKPQTHTNVKAQPQSLRQSLTIEMPNDASPSPSISVSERSDDDAVSRSSASVATGSSPGGGLGDCDGEDLEPSRRSSRGSSTKSWSASGTGSKKDESKKHFFKGWDFCLLDEERRAGKKFDAPDSLVGWRVRIRPDWTDEKITGVVIDTHKNLRRRSVFRVLLDERRPPADDASTTTSTTTTSTNTSSGKGSHDVRSFDLRRIGRNHGLPFAEVAYVGKVIKSTTEVLGSSGKGRSTSYEIDHDAHAMI